ncbi:MAG: TfoX/Sxy family protein [Gammaproteobacteria bacterium]|nr:TfoX/Sxy family protein [Gammaproteobacteria bacterium]MDH5628585.1 TfoX/Sxy family protein [Gammaproteobacteria bacterium]
MEDKKSEFANYVVDLLQVIGPISSKRMFGGYGLFLDSLMFALIAENTLYLKADDVSKNNFIENGLGPFGYSKNGKRYDMSYYQAPEEVFESMESMREWGNIAYECALRAASKKSKSK